jgi:hypothetical protein
MAGSKCVHGLDARFCAICNPRPPNDPRLAEILNFLNDEQVRATYGAVADVLGVIPRAMGARLGPHTREASWIVSAETGLPTDYREHEIHPALQRDRDIITVGGELKTRLAAWKATRQT